MIHLYCGDGKGKTTAAMGLALRMAGRGKPVVIAQFLKGGGQRRAVRPLSAPEGDPAPRPGTDQILLPAHPGGAGGGAEALPPAHCSGPDGGREIPDGLLVLDEVCAAVNTGLLPLEEVLSCLEAAACEVVLTGRDPAPELLARADYVTEMKKLRHPYDRGTAARQGVEW